MECEPHNEPIIAAALHAQRHAERVGRSRLAVEVWGWTIRNAASLSAMQRHELFELCREET